MKKIAVAVLSLMVAACGVLDKIRGKNDEVEPLKPNPLPTITREVSLERVWRFDAGGREPVGLRPALGGTAVYVANAEGGVAAVDIEKGSTQWRQRLDIQVSGGVGTGEGLVMVGGLDGEVVALDARDGSEVWGASVSSEVMAPPVATAGTVVVRTIDGGVSGLSTTSGEHEWDVRHEVPSLTLRGSGPPLTAQGVAVMGFADGKLSALDIRNGTLLWQQEVSRPSGTNEVERMTDVDATPVLAGNELYAVAYHGYINAYRLDVNQLMWRKEISSYTDISIDASNVYVSDSSGRVHALERSTGRELWVQEQLLRRRLSGPAVSGQYVLVGDYEGYVHVMDKSDGHLVGRGRFGSRISLQPLVRGNHILVMSEDGKLTSVSIVPGAG